MSGGVRGAAQARRPRVDGRKARPRRGVARDPPQVGCKRRCKPGQHRSPLGGASCAHDSTEILSGEKGIRTPGTLAGTPDFRNVFGPAASDLPKIRHFARLRKAPRTTEDPRSRCRRVLPPRDSGRASSSGRRVPSPASAHVRAARRYRLMISDDLCPVRSATHASRLAVGQTHGDERGAQVVHADG